MIPGGPVLNKKSIMKHLPTILALLFTATLAGGVPVEGSYSTGFKSASIEITSPVTSGLPCEGILHTEGKSDLEQVWYCVRGPGGEIATYPAAVNNGRFQLDIYLRCGQGTYTIWAGDNPGHFDGRIRFLVENSSQSDTRYTAPSAYVDSDNKEITALAGALVRPQMTDMEKLQVIYDWVTGNISYDYQAYKNGRNQLVKASATLEKKTGICRDYSLVVAALARAAGLPARVIYGKVYSDSEQKWYSHAWNEVYTGGRWIALDSTRDAGYMEKGRFVPAPSRKHFDITREAYAMYYSDPTCTTH